LISRLPQASGSALGLHGSTPEQYASGARIIAFNDGTLWTSQFLPTPVPLPNGNSFLCTIDDTLGNTIALRFWSFNTQRRSGRSEVSKKWLWTLWAAMPAKVAEHGRWRILRSSLDMPLAYLEWSVEDRVCITIVRM
jgi:hypothetical protein